MNERAEVRRMNRRAGGGLPELVVVVSVAFISFNLCRTQYKTAICFISFLALITRLLPSFPSHFSHLKYNLLVFFVNTQHHPPSFHKDGMNLSWWNT